jgi:hypothetical protein
VRRCKIRVLRVRLCKRREKSGVSYIDICIKYALPLLLKYRENGNVFSSNALKASEVSESAEYPSSMFYSALETLTSPSELLSSLRASVRVVRNVRVAPAGPARSQIEQQSAQT